MSGVKRVFLYLGKGVENQKNNTMNCSTHHQDHLAKIWQQSDKSPARGYDFSSRPPVTPFSGILRDCVTSPVVLMLVFGDNESVSEIQLLTWSEESIHICLSIVDHLDSAMPHSWLEPRIKLFLPNVPVPVIYFARLLSSQKHLFDPDLFSAAFINPSGSLETILNMQEEW